MSYSSSSWVLDLPQVDDVYPKDFSSSPLSLLFYSLLAEISESVRERELQGEIEGRNKWHGNLFWP